MTYIYTCQWCFKQNLSTWYGETICWDCDSKIIDLEHPIYECPESLFLISVGYSKKDIEKIIEEAVSYEQAIRTLIYKCDALLK